MDNKCYENGITNDVRVFVSQALEKSGRMLHETIVIRRRGRDTSFFLSSGLLIPRAWC